MVKASKKNNNFFKTDFFTKYRKKNVCLVHFFLKEGDIESKARLLPCLTGRILTERWNWWNMSAFASGRVIRH